MCNNYWWTTCTDYIHVHAQIYGIIMNKRIKRNIHKHTVYNISHIYTDIYKYIYIYTFTGIYYIND